ncbi:MAG: FGGY-family carbohydrate kinase [Pseudorhodobacter sp.]
MTGPRHIAVIDIGKTNAKLALVDGGSLAEIAVVTRPNVPLPGPPWLHTDIEVLWQFFVDHLRAFHADRGVDAISVTTHGAAAVLLDAAGNLAVPMLDYEYSGPETLQPDYDALRPDFSQSGSPRLAAGLNLGAQLHWLFATRPDLQDRVAHVLTYPQYWGWRLTGQMATDVTMLGSHTDLWDPWCGQFSGLVEKLGLQEKIAPARRPDQVLGTLLPEISELTGLRPETPVAVGIHDSNASLYPYVLSRKPPFTVVSTGTWVISMAVGGGTKALNPEHDVLVNVNALGQPVPSARFMGGREYELIRAGSEANPGDADRAAVLAGGLMLLPAVEPSCGPFRGREMRWIGRPANDGQRMVALSWYLALVTDVCLDQIGADGPVILEGSFTRNEDFLAMLALRRPGRVEVATSATGTSAGAALLCLDHAIPPETCLVSPPADPGALEGYARAWRAALQL